LILNLLGKVSSRYLKVVRLVEHGRRFGYWQEDDGDEAEG
jgi:hypothetical protein